VQVRRLMAVMETDGCTFEDAVDVLPSTQTQSRNGDVMPVRTAEIGEPLKLTDLR
jgi:hypothetical protein